MVLDDVKGDLKSIHLLPRLLEQSKHIVLDGEIHTGDGRFSLDQKDGLGLLEIALVVIHG